jgi:hypothetical protein
MMYHQVRFLDGTNDELHKRTLAIFAEAADAVEWESSLLTCGSNSVLSNSATTLAIDSVESCSLIFPTPPLLILNDENRDKVGLWVT